MIFKLIMISRLPFSIEAEDLFEAIHQAKKLAGPEYEWEEHKPNEQERWFYISYNGTGKVKESYPFEWQEDLAKRMTTVIGHLAFSHLGFPSLLYITEQLVPDQCKKRGTPVPTNIVLTFFHEFATEQDFDDFTVGRRMGDHLDDLIRRN